MQELSVSLPCKSLPQSYKVNLVIVPISQMKKLRLSKLQPIHRPIVQLGCGINAQEGGALPQSGEGC